MHDQQSLTTLEGGHSAQKIAKQPCFDTEMCLVLASDVLRLALALTDTILMEWQKGVTDVSGNPIGCVSG